MGSEQIERPLCAGFLQSSELFPNRPALEVEGQVFTYAQLRARAECLADALTELDPGNDPPLTAVFGYRSATAFAGVLAALLRGHGYVPLNRTFPVERTRVMLERSLCHCVIIDNASAAQLDAVLEGIDRPLVLLLTDMEDVGDFAQRWPRHRVMGKSTLKEKSSGKYPVALPGEKLAYLLFTSGSTGSPKGVLLAQRNVCAYVDFVTKRYGLNEQDRCSQTFDMTFDLSAHDMFVTWEKGACLCCPTQKEMIKPDRFINQARLTRWFSVPSTAVFMRRMGLLKPGSYPGLRLSLFCGEALPMEIARQWSAAAPNSILENIYGPTELTIACTAYRWDPAASPAECDQGIVPIGEPFAGMDALVVNEELKEVNSGEDGELVMTGPQLSLGYWKDPEKTKRAFVSIEGKPGIYYRTGDRVRRPAPGKPIVYLGRMDNQMKILGHRVELGEIEAVLRRESGVDGVVAVGWPVTASGADGIEVFLQSDHCDTEALRDRLKGLLPVYMQPRRIHVLARFPLNANGKFDRKALLATLDKTTT